MGPVVVVVSLGNMQFHFPHPRLFCRLYLANDIPADLSADGRGHPSHGGIQQTLLGADGAADYNERQYGKHHRRARLSVKDIGGCGKHQEEQVKEESDRDFRQVDVAAAGPGADKHFIDGPKEGAGKEFLLSLHIEEIHSIFLLAATIDEDAAPHEDHCKNEGNPYSLVVLEKHMGQGKEGLRHRHVQKGLPHLPGSSPQALEKQGDRPYGQKAGKKALLPPFPEVPKEFYADIRHEDDAVQNAGANPQVEKEYQKAILPLSPFDAPRAGNPLPKEIEQDADVPKGGNGIMVIAREIHRFKKIGVPILPMLEYEEMKGQEHQSQKTGCPCFQGKPLLHDLEEEIEVKRNKGAQDSGGYQCHRCEEIPQERQDNIRCNRCRQGHERFRKDFDGIVVMPFWKSNVPLLRKAVPIIAIVHDHGMHFRKEGQHDEKHKEHKSCLTQELFPVFQHGAFPPLPFLLRPPPGVYPQAASIPA